MVIDKLCALNLMPYLKKSDLYFNPTNGLKPHDLPFNIPVVSVIQDLQHNFYPHFFVDGGFDYRNKYYGYTIARSDGMVTISQNEKNNFKRYFNIDNIEVIYHSGYLYDGYKDIKLSDKFKSRFSEYYLYGAVGWAHKNHLNLIDAFYLLNKPYSTPKYNLVLTGLTGFGKENQLIFKKIKELKAEDYIEVYDHVPDEQLVSLMRRSKGLIHPSLYEGFGLPLIEAMACGCPVVTSSASSLPEVVGDAGITVDPHDTDSLAQAMRRVLTDSKLREEMISKGLKQAKKFSWDKAAEQTLGVYNRVAAG